MTLMLTTMMQKKVLRNLGIISCLLSQHLPSFQNHSFYLEIRGGSVLCLWCTSWRPYLFLAYDHNDKICRDQFSEIASNTPHSIPRKSLFTWNFWEVNAFIQESCEILTIENQHSWMSGPDDVIIVDHLFTSTYWSYHCHHHHYYYHKHHHHDHPHLLKHADLVVDHEEGLGGDQLLDPVEILLKLRSRLDLDVPEVKLNEKCYEESKF